jgi:hypothetical protein
MRNLKRLATNTSRYVAAALCFTAFSVAHAQNWEFDPRLQLGYEYNDNYRLDFPGQEIDVSGGMLDVRLPVKLVDPVRKAELSPRVRSTYFPDERDQDSNDYFLGGLYEQRTQRQTLGIEANWSRQDVIRSELPSSDIDGNLGDPTLGDAGRVLLRNKRDQLRVLPYWQYDLSQRHRLEAGAHYLDADYEDNSNGDPILERYRQRDFTDAGINAGWGYAVTQRSRLTFRGRASHYKTVVDSDAYGAEVEWRSDYSETAHLYMRVGGQQTDIDRPNTSTETNVIAGLGGRWDWPTTNLFADLTRSVGPNSSGAVIERSELRLRMARAIQPRLSVLAGARATRDEAIDSSTYPQREYITGEVGFDWRFTRTWSLVGQYHYIWQEYADEPSDTASNAITLGVVYEPGRGE